MASIQQMWLKNAVWDSVFLLGGIWLLPLLAVCSLLPKALLLLSLALTAVLWLSHRVATFFTIFCTPTYRALIAQEPLRFMVIPALVLLLSVAFALSPYPASPVIRLQVLGTFSLPQRIILQREQRGQRGGRKQASYTVFEQLQVKVDQKPDGSLGEFHVSDNLGLMNW